MTGESASTFVMAKPCKSLMRTSPTRPNQVVSKRERRSANETKEKPPDFSNTEGNHYWKIRRCLDLSRIVCYWLWHLGCLLRLFFGASSPPLARKAAKKARASIERVTYMLFRIEAERTILE